MASSFTAEAARMSSCSRASLIARASSTASEASTKARAAPACMSGTSQRAESSLSTPSGRVGSMTAESMGVGSSVSECETMRAPVFEASGKSRFTKSVGTPVRGR